MRITNDMPHSVSFDTDILEMLGRINYFFLKSLHQVMQFRSNSFQFSVRNDAFW